MDQKIVKVLLVEDDEVSRVVMERFLKSKGYQVETAVNGEKALALLENEQYDIVIMDIVLPKIGGFHLARQMKKHSHMQNIPIIAMSAYLEPDDLKNNMVPELDAFLTKPFKPEELLEIIVKLSSDKTPDLDWSGLLRRTDGDMEFVKEVAEIFYRNSKEIIAEIEKSSNYDVIGELAHRLKGSAATAGALLLVNMAASIQEANKNKDIQEIKTKCTSWASALSSYVKCLAEKGIMLNTR